MSHSARTITRQLAVLFSIGLISMATFAQSLEVIQLKHRTAQELIPTLQPLVAQGGVLSGQEYTLFVRTTPANLAEIRRVLAQLDRAPRQLLVSVRSATRQQIEREGISVQGELSTRGSNAQIAGVDSKSQLDRGSVASVAVLEGNAAMINNAASIPIITAIAGGAGRRPWIAAQTEQRNLANGFVVTPRVNGDSVILEIQQRAETARGGSIETQQLQTQVNGRVGEWIALGGVSQTHLSTERDLGTRSYSTRSDDRTIWVKIEAQ
jgi:type II secretory pathway component GspD/PulD (secretin)